MATTLKQFKEKLRDISLLDKIRSKIYKSPNERHYCEAYSLFISKFLESGVEISSIDEFSMTLINGEGKLIKIWCDNYPYNYGCRLYVGTSHPHFDVYPSWDVTLKLRKIQLTKKQELINRFIAISLNAY
jgi:hypothetical protein